MATHGLAPRSRRLWLRRVGPAVLAAVLLLLVLAAFLLVPPAEGAAMELPAAPTTEHSAPLIEAFDEHVCPEA